MATTRFLHCADKDGNSVLIHVVNIIKYGFVPDDPHEGVRVFTNSDDSEGYSVGYTFNSDMDELLTLIYGKDYQIINEPPEQQLNLDEPLFLG